MGQAIVYCSRCNAQLREADFQKGSAVKAEHKTYCLKCLPEGVVPNSPEKSSDSNPIRKRSGTSLSMAPAPQKEPPRPVLIWALGLAMGVIVLILALFLFSGPSSRPSPAPETSSSTPPAPPPPPSLPPAETAARAALARLLRKISEQPTDLDGQQDLLEDAARRAEVTSIGPEIQRERERLAQRRQDLRTAELAEVEQQVRTSPEDQSAILLKAARGRHSDAAWTAAIDRLLNAVAPPPPPTTATPLPASAAPQPASVPKPAPEAPLFPPGWEAGLRHAAARDYAAAQAVLDKSPDAPILRAVATLQADAQQILLRTPRGQKVSWEASGGRRLEGAFLRENGGILDVKTETGMVDVEIGELTPSTLIAAARAAGAVDPRTAAAFCLIEGDLAGAGTDRNVLPPRFWAWGEGAARAALEPSRGLYAEALAALAKPATAADGVQRLQALLRDRADDAFVRRNRAAIATRGQGGREFLFLAEEIKASGIFRAGKGGKLDSGWTCENDVDPAKQKETFLEVEFSSVPETPYKAWAYVGGCCQEVFDFSCQGTEMEAGKGTKESAEPGSAVGVPVKPWVSGVKKTHAQHNGPKQPSRWEWTALPLPRYARPGPQRIRILSDQKGFSVACIVVSATRTGPPSDADFKELIRARGDRPKQVAQAPKAIAMYVCKLDGTDHRLVGDLKDNSLYGVPMFGQCFTGLERNQNFVLPEQGELRFTYFMKTSSTLIARLRINKDGTTFPFDVEIASPVVGTPTEVRMPFADFKRPFMKDGPKAVPGDTTQMIYIAAADPGCGLRIDALSLVEIRK